jgi:hypothetical protein
MTIPGDPPVYNSQIPLVKTTIAEAQKLFLNNFSTLFNAFGMNHVALNDPTNPGNHNVVQLLEQTISESTQSHEISIYSKKVEGQTDQIFMRQQGNGKEFQLTQYQIYSLIPLELDGVIYQKRYFSFLPGGVIVYFGEIIPFGNPFYISLEPAVCSNISGINLCPIGGLESGLVQSNVSITGVNGKATAIQLTSVEANANQYYLAFGNI